MTTGRRFLTFQGSDVAPIACTAAGRAVVVYLDRHGQPTSHTAEAWPHELRGLGWHLATIKQLLALLPVFPPVDSVPSTTAGAAHPPNPTACAGGFLHAHHSAPDD